MCEVHAAEEWIDEGGLDEFRERSACSAEMDTIAQETPSEVLQ